MQTKRSQRMIGVVVCSLWMATTAGFVAAQAPAAAAKPKVEKPAPPADPAAVLKVIPANAAAFVAVRNIAEMDYDVSDVLAKLDLPLESMGFPGLLTMIKEQAGITEGLDANSGAAIILLDCTQAKLAEDLEKRAVIVLPTDKAEALATALGGTKDGEGYQLTIGGEPAIGAEKGGFLIVAPTESKDALKEVMQAKEGIDKRLPADRMKAYQDSDLFAWAALQGFSKELREAPITTIKGMMMMGDPGASAEEIDDSMAEFTKFVDGLKEVSLGLALDSKVGLRAAFWYQALPDSEIAKRLAALKLNDNSLLVGLPDEAVVLAGGAVNTAREEDIQKALDRVLKPEIIGDDIDEAQLKELKVSLAKLATGFEQAGVSFAGLPGEGQDGMLAFTLVARTNNSEQMQAEMRKVLGKVKEMLIKAAVSKEALTEEESKAVNDAVQIKENAEKLTGAVVDHFVVDITKLPEADEEQIEQIKSVVGQEGILVRIAAIGEKHLAVTFGGGAKRFAQVVEQVQKNQAPLGDRKTIKMVADRLPGQKRIMEGYLSIDRLLALVMDISNKLGQPVPFPLAMKETAPLALVGSQVGEGAVEVAALIPIELAQSVAETIKPMLMMFMGGGPGGMGMPEEEGEEEETPTPISPPGVK